MPWSLAITTTKRTLPPPEEKEWRRSTQKEHSTERARPGAQPDIRRGERTHLLETRRMESRQKFQLGSEARQPLEGPRVSYTLAVSTKAPLTQALMCISGKKKTRNKKPRRQKLFNAFFGQSLNIGELDLVGHCVNKNTAITAFCYCWVPGATAEDSHRIISVPCPPSPESAAVVFDNEIWAFVS